MAETLDDCEFWLPPQFLSDDDLLMDKKFTNTTDNHNNWNARKDSAKVAFGVPYEYPYEFGSHNVFSSDLSSPVESVVGSTETESDEEDLHYLAGLTHQMAHSTLDDGFPWIERSRSSDNAKGWVVSGSPQSTLCPTGNGCGCKQVRSRGSPNGSVKSSSSPQATWDLLYAAAGEVAKMKMNEEACYGNRGLLDPTRKHSPVVNNAARLDFALYQKLQAFHFQQLRQQQLMKQRQSVGVGMWRGEGNKGSGMHPAAVHQHHNYGGRNVNHDVNGGGGRPVGLSASAWPALTPAHHQQQQKQVGSGMRAVFLGNPVAKRECAGTGVFLPRRAGTPTVDTRKKPACATVLLPAKVVQALNLNLDDVGGHAQFQPRFTPDGDAALRLRSGDFFAASNQRRIFRSQPGINAEMRLPQEWTY